MGTLGAGVALCGAGVAGASTTAAGGSTGTGVTLKALGFDGAGSGRATFGGGLGRSILGGGAGAGCCSGTAGGGAASGSAMCATIGALGETGGWDSGARSARSTAWSASEAPTA